MALGKDEDEQRLRFEEMLRNADLRNAGARLFEYVDGGHDQVGYFPVGFLETFLEHADA